MMTNLRPIALFSRFAVCFLVFALSSWSLPAQDAAQSATPPAPEKRVLFSTAFVERQAADIIEIQLMDDETLVFDKAETYTLFDSGLKKPRKLVITARRAILEQPVTIRSFDPDSDTQRPPQIKAFDAPAAQGPHGTDGPHCTPGGNGDPGVAGSDGARGTTGYSASLVLIDIKELQGNNVLTILNTGGRGGQGQAGQVGGTGGTAGRGGDAVDHLFDCACGPQSAGQPGPAGPGGRGGKGGTGGDAQTVMLSANLKSLADAGTLLKVDVSGGPGGHPGRGAAGGLGGFGNEAGSGSTNCGKGGGVGSSNGPARTAEVMGDLGDGDKGKGAMVRSLEKSYWDPKPAIAK